MGTYWGKVRMPKMAINHLNLISSQFLSIPTVDTLISKQAFCFELEDQERSEQTSITYS